VLRVDSVEDLLGVRAPFACLFSCWWFVPVAPQLWLLYRNFSVHPHA